MAVESGATEAVSEMDQRVVGRGWAKPAVVVMATVVETATVAMETVEEAMARGRATTRLGARETAVGAVEVARGKAVVEMVTGVAVTVAVVMAEVAYVEGVVKAAATGSNPDPSSHSSSVQS